MFLEGHCSQCSLDRIYGGRSDLRVRLRAKFAQTEDDDNDQRSRRGTRHDLEFADGKTTFAGERCRQCPSTGTVQYHVGGLLHREERGDQYDQLREQEGCDTIEKDTDLWHE